MTGLSFREFELAYSAAPARPALELCFRWGDLYATSLKRFAPFRLRPADVRLETVGLNPSDFLLTCYLFDFTFTARFRIGSVDLWTRSPAVTGDLDLGIALVEAAVGTFRDIASGVPIESQAITAQGHFSVPGESVSVRIARYLTVTPPGTPQLLPIGVAFGAELADGAKASVRLEPSLKYLDPGDGFIRVDCQYPGIIPEKDACLRTSEFYQATIDRLGLDRAA